MPPPPKAPTPDEIKADIRKRLDLSSSASKLPADQILAVPSDPGGLLSVFAIESEGNTLRIETSAVPGSAAVTAMLRQLRLAASVEELGEIVSCVRAHALDHKGPVSGEALTSIWRSVCASSHARGM